MRVVAVHDVHGNIAALAASPPDSGTMALGLASGQRTSEIEVPDLPSAETGGEVVKRLREILEGTRVDVEAVPRARLVNKSER
jgi:hypothetical protein